MSDAAPPDNLDDPDDDFADDADQPLPSEQPTVDAGNIKVVRRAVRRRKRDAREAEEFWTAVFSTPVGRREMYRLLAEAGTFEVKFACGPVGFPDHLATWYHKGAHDFGQRVYQGWLLRMPQEAIRMRAENDPALATQPKRQDD